MAKAKLFMVAGKLDTPVERKGKGRHSAMMEAEFEGEARVPLF